MTSQADEFPKRPVPDRPQLLEALADAVKAADDAGTELPFGVTLALHELRRYGGRRKAGTR